MTTLRFALLTLAMLQIAAPAVARTWRVEKDGTGDFTILYEAADACAAGDTILIGPGRFEEYRREPDYQWNAYCCIHLRVPGVTLIGSGVDATTVGLEHDNSHFVIGLSVSLGVDLNVRDLTVSVTDEGIHFEGPNLSVTDCNFDNCEIGIATWSPQSTAINHCRFVGCRNTGVLGAHSNGVSIIECEFADGFAYAISGVGGSGWIVRDTIVHDYDGGIEFERGATGVVERCHITTVDEYAAPIGIILGAVFELTDNVFVGDHWSAHFGTNGTVLTASNNIFQGGDYATIRIGLTPVDFHDNHIINGGGMSVIAEWERGSLSQPYDLDFSGNYWGTTDPAQLAAWIDDYNDHPPQNNYHYVIVDFTPFADQPVQTEQTSWGAVKSLFR